MRGTANGALPLTVEELTPEWVGWALAQRNPLVSVTGIEIEELVWGTSTKVRLRVSYAGNPGADGPPETVCVKGGFDERMRSFNVTDLYRLEASFFRDLARKLEVRMPRSWYADADADQGIVIMDDLIAAGARFWKPTEAWDPATLSSALDSLARMHAATWGMRPEEHSWLTRGSPAVQATIPALFSDENWDTMLARPDARFLPGEQLDRERMLRGFTALWQLDASSTPCLVHWDPHIGNTYLDADGQLGFVDWQCVCLTSCLHDVGYMIAGALIVGDRRAHEKELLARYLDALETHGGPRIPWDDAWLDYRRYQLYGFVWVLTTTAMQSADIIAAMTERHAAAIADHRALAALGV